MWINKIILIIVGVFIISLVSAGITDTISDGQILTQRDLDAMNVTSLDLKCIQSGYELQLKGLNYKLSCLSIQPETTASGNYVIYKNNFVSDFSYLYLGKCIVRLGFNDCKVSMAPKIIEDINRQKESIQRKIINYQTIDFSSYDWNIDLGKL